MDELREKMKMLKEKRKQASHVNFKEVLHENERAKKPVNWEKRLEMNQKRLQMAEEKLKAEEAGHDYERQKNLEYRADEIEKWEKLKAGKKRQESGFIDFEEASRRQYGKLTKQLKPDLEGYNSLKEEIGEEKFYLKNAESLLKSSLIKDSKEGIDRMVEDVNKNIELRSKRSRRRRFDDEADIDYINERNMKFNKKLERFYGEYTEEIKQNFERGTAM